MPSTAAPHLLAIKRGRVSYGAVEAEIEALRDEVEQAAERPFLPDEPGHEAAEALGCTHTGGRRPERAHIEDDAVRARIDAALREVEQIEGVRILLGVEFGSRAWGFPSRNSG